MRNYHLQVVEFSYVIHADYIGKGPTLVCIPKSSKDLDKIDTLGSISKDDICKQLAELNQRKQNKSLYLLITNIKNNTQ